MQAPNSTRANAAAILAAHPEPARQAKQILTRAATVQTHARSGRPVNGQRDPPPFWRFSETSQGSTGFLLTDLRMKPTYANDAAIAILGYPDRSRAAANPAVFVQERMRSIFQTEHFTPGLRPVDFLSGRRRYECRPFFIESREVRMQSPIVALLIERRPRDRIELSEASRRFHLSRRECETVQHLISGLTTKEVAQRMGVSPNTIKQFVRLIMSKMAVTTRSGIVGKLISG